MNKSKRNVLFWLSTATKVQYVASICFSLTSPTFLNRPPLIYVSWFWLAVDWKFHHTPSINHFNFVETAVIEICWVAINEALFVEIHQLLLPVKIRWLCPVQRVKTPCKRMRADYETKLQLVVRLPLWTSVEYGISVHCHYSQVYSDLEWLYRLGSHQWIKYICQQIIYIR